MDMKEQFRELNSVPDFESKFPDPAVAETDAMNVLQINVGRLCNLACKHCHVEAGPNRTEVMSKEVMEACLKAYTNWGFETIDIRRSGDESELQMVRRRMLQDMQACHSQIEHGHTSRRRLHRHP